MNRREFLKRSLIASAGIAVGGSLLMDEAAARARGQKIIGLQLYSLRDAMGKSVPATLKKVANMGYGILETASYSDGKLYGYAPAEFRKMCNDLGMRVSGAHLGQNYTKETDAKVMDWWKVALDTQAVAGCNYAVQPSFPVGEKLDDIKLYCDYFNKVGELAKARGLRFGFHNHAVEFKSIGGQVILDYMIANTDPNNVMYELDVYWAVRGGVDPMAYIEKYTGRIPLLHIKDDATIGASGKIDFEAIFNAAYANGMESYFVEVETRAAQAEKDVRQSAAYLKAAAFVK